jgi:hypothetical protein
MLTQDGKTAREGLRTPRAAAIAGIALALILGTALVLIRSAVPAGSRDASTWLADR